MSTYEAGYAHGYEDALIDHQKTAQEYLDLDPEIRSLLKSALQEYEEQASLREGLAASGLRDKLVRGMLTTSDVERLREILTAQGETELTELIGAN